LGSQLSLKLEPTAMVVLGKKFQQRFNKFGLIDSHNTELSENNIFNANRYSGIDFHDYGSRLSYGINSSLGSNSLYVDAFLGQLIHKNNANEGGNSEYVGSVSANIKDNYQIFYRFRGDEKLKPIRNEFGATGSSDNLRATINYTSLHKLLKYFPTPDSSVKKNNISQLDLAISYQLFKNFWIGGRTNLDLSEKKTKFLLNSIEVAYLFDCVKVRGKIENNFLSDSVRGVKKARNYSFSIGLKDINM
jgi:LPS-assembly protein